MQALKNGMYAKIPDGFEKDGFTIGKLYPIYDVNKNGSISFRILDDEDYECYCLLKSCSHLDNGDWVIVEAVKIK